MALSKFKEFVLALIRDIVARANAAGAASAAKIQQLSNELSSAHELILKLQAQPGLDEKTKELAQQAVAILGDLDAFSTDLAAEFNPTPGTDAAAGAVTASPAIPTPIEASRDEVGRGLPTPPLVIDAAIDSIGSAIDASLVE